MSRTRRLKTRSPKKNIAGWARRRAVGTSLFAAGCCSGYARVWVARVWIWIWSTNRHLTTPLVIYHSFLPLLDPSKSHINFIPLAGVSLRLSIILEAIMTKLIIRDFAVLELMLGVRALATPILNQRAVTGSMSVSSSRSTSTTLTTSADSGVGAV